MVIFEDSKIFFGQGLAKSQNLSMFTFVLQTMLTANVNTMQGQIKYFIDDCQENYLLVEFEAVEDWSAGEGDTYDIEVLGIDLNGTMSQKIASVRINRPDWWAGIHQQIQKQIWEQAAQAA